MRGKYQMKITKYSKALMWLNVKGVMNWAKSLKKKKKKKRLIYAFLLDTAFLTIHICCLQNHSFNKLPSVEYNLVICSFISVISSLFRTLYSLRKLTGDWPPPWPRIVQCPLDAHLWILQKIIIWSSGDSLSTFFMKTVNLYICSHTFHLLYSKEVCSFRCNH